MRVAAIDLGSNSTLLLVADIQSGRIQNIVRDELRVTRMGQGVQATKKLSKEALSRLELCLSEYRKIINELKVDTVLAMATSAARDVENATELFQLGERHGFKIEIIPGDKEAEITFKGSTFEESETEGFVVVDTGGGSTEVISKADGRFLGMSLDVGSVRLSEMFITGHPISLVEVEKVKKYISKEIEKNKSRLIFEKTKEMLAVAGTPTTMAAVIAQKEYSHAVVHNKIISLSELELWCDRLCGMSVEERQALPGMDKKRADVIVVGVMILIAVGRLLGVQQMRVSDRGVRFGVALLAYERAGRQ